MNPSRDDGVAVDFDATRRHQAADTGPFLVHGQLGLLGEVVDLELLSGSSERSPRR